MNERNFVSFYLNGKACKATGEDALLNLSEYIRKEKSLSGTKVVCAEGDCGACTILCASIFDSSISKNNKLNYLPVNSCVVPIFAVDGCHIVSVEGLSQNKQLTEVQKSMYENHGSQCGYCTPGMVNSLTAYYESKPQNASCKDIKNALTGNLCRCTGYLPIVESALSVDQSKYKGLNETYDSKAIIADLKENLKLAALVGTEEVQVRIPTETDQLLKFKSDKNDLILFSGGTDLGVQRNKGRAPKGSIVSLNSIKSLYECQIENNKVKIGAKTTISSLQNLIETEIPSLRNLIEIFASPQIKNIGTVIGNIANASPIGDLIPPFFVLDAVLQVASSSGNREIPIKELYLDYKKLSLKPDEVILSMEFIVPSKDSLLKFYKVSQRRDLDISAVTTAIYMNHNGDNISDFKIAMGGVGPVVSRLDETESSINGKKLSREVFDSGSEILRGEIKPMSDLRGSAEFRTQLGVNLLKAFKIDLVEEGIL